MRILWRKPAYALLVILTLAVGTGACLSVFTVVDSVLLRPLPFSSPDRLALVPSLNRDGTGKIEEYGSALRDYVEWKNRSQSFSSMAAMQPTEVALTGSGDPEQLEAGLITANLFDTLGVRPFEGRFFTPDEEVANSSVVIISHGLWRRRFGSQADVFSRPIIVDGVARQIVGVAPPDFFFVATSELWLPLNMQGVQNPGPVSRNVAVTARLANGATIADASQEMKAIAEQLAREVPGNEGWSARAVPIREPYVREVRGTLYLLFGSVCFLLLMVCINVANLVLVRNIERRSEFLVRAALGANRKNLLRETLAENLTLTLTGGVLGIAASALALKPIIALSPLIGSSPAGNRILNSVTFDIRVVIFALALSLMIGLVLSLIPIVSLSGSRLSDALKSSSRRTAGSVPERRLQKSFVVAQLATSFLLLIGAAVMGDNFLRLKKIDPGFKTESLVTARLALPATRYENHQKRAQFQKQLMEKARTIPGVVSVSASTRLPLNEFSMTTLFEVDGIETPREGFMANFRRIGPSYFQTLQTRLVEGREFTTADEEKTMPVAVISREMAKRYWPGQSAVGKRIRRISQQDRAWRTVVGVVEDLKDSSLTAAPGATLYVPYSQGSIPTFHLVIRSVVTSGQILRSLRATVHSLDKDLPLYQEATAEQLFMDSLSRPRFAAYLLSSFAFLGMFIALVGVYGVVSYSTAQRTSEIGIRIAVGAQRGAILRLILAQSARISLWGILAGILASVIAELSISTLSSNFSRPGIYLAVSAILIGITLLASLLPARRATRLPPVLALRYE